MRRAGRRLLNVTAGGNNTGGISSGAQFDTTQSSTTPIATTTTSTTLFATTTNYTTTPSPFSPTPSTTAAPAPAAPTPPAAASIVQSPKHVVTMTLKLEYSKDQFEQKEVKDKFIIAMAAAANTDKANVKILSIKVRARHCVPVVFLRSAGGGWGRSCVLHAR